MNQPILLVDESAEDVRALKDAFKRVGLTNRIVVHSNAEEAAEYLSRISASSNRSKGFQPGVVFVSLHLPECGGMQCLHWMQTRPELKQWLKIVLVRRDSLKEVVRAYELGAQSFLVKPSQDEDLKTIVRSFHGYWTFT